MRHGLVPQVIIFFDNTVYFRKGFKQLVYCRWYIAAWNWDVFGAVWSRRALAQLTGRASSAAAGPIAGPLARPIAGPMAEAETSLAAPARPCAPCPCCKCGLRRTLREEKRMARVSCILWAMTPVGGRRRRWRPRSPRAPPPPPPLAPPLPPPSRTPPPQRQGYPTRTLTLSQISRYEVSARPTETNLKRPSLRCQK